MQFELLVEREGVGRPSASRAIDLEQALRAQRDLGEKVFIATINESIGETELFL